METPKVLYQFPKSAGETFMPSNGTEGMVFTDAFCEQCLHEKFTHTQDHKDKKCDILNRSIIHWMEPVEKGYPKEWVYNAEGWPVCTSWVKWDWDNDGDPDDPENPNYRQPDDPNQLCMPFLLNEITGEAAKAKELTLKITPAIRRPNLSTIHC